MPIFTIHPESALEPPMPGWRKIVLDWVELDVLPPRWEFALKEWRAIYYIYDKSDRKGYVGAAHGEDNLLGRWKNYASNGYGGNILLKPPSDPHNFQFSILERLGPDESPETVIELEKTWKLRLHTRAPEGLNEN
jgi:hypothetical protein